MLKRMITTLFAFAFVMLIVTQTKAQANEQVIMATKENVVIYNNNGKKMSEVGRMLKEEPMKAQNSSEQDYWRVKFGNAFGLVKKSDVQVANDTKVPAVNQQANTNTAVLIEKDVDVYDNSRGGLKKFAVIKAGIRYPVLSDFGTWWKVDVGGRIGFIQKSSTTIDKGIPVLMYHHILTPQEKANSPFANSSTTITTQEFYAQMDYLKEYGYTTISTSDLEKYLDHQINLPAKSVLLTLDDGNISSRIYAYPKLKELGFIADQFIITSRMPKTPATFDPARLHFLSQQEMDQMTDVYNYYGHTHRLHNLTDKNQSHLIMKSKGEVKEDLQLNREILNGMTYLAYPFGQYNETTVKLLKETGFTMAYTIKNGKATLGVNKMAIPRIGIEPNLSINEFGKKVATGSAVLDRPTKPAPPAPNNPNQLFPDVKESDYFFEGVQSLTKRGMIQGYPDGLFKPFRSVTRGQAAKILANALNLDLESVPDPAFKDVDQNNEYFKPIAALVNAGIIQGYPDGSFKPNNTLTRAHMSKMIVLGYQLAEEEIIDNPFEDIEIESEFAGYIQTLYRKGITTGTTDKTFSPNAEVKRGQLATFIIRTEKNNIVNE